MVLKCFKNGVSVGTDWQGQMIFPCYCWRLQIGIIGGLVMF